MYEVIELLVRKPNSKFICNGFAIQRLGRTIVVVKRTLNETIPQIKKRAEDIKRFLENGGYKN